MNTREQFGNYLLLKKLSEDPLGETFRAGLVGAKGMERVVLLRIFNGQGIDGPRLWEATQSRAGIHELLRSPNIGEGVEMGQLEGIPFVAYDYVSGKNLATLLEQSAKKRNYIPAEHALLISERLALALATASETRDKGERILHGFLVPQLAMISNEGETRLLGFGVAPGLRSFAANPVVRQHFGRYLAPEALGGEPIHRSDDIYSLGVILFELLTGKPLPPPAADGYASIVDGAELAAEGTPIPDELRDLLKKSLVPRAARIPDAGSWHKTLNRWMFEGQYNPTTFNLAFFMHNLFRQEIERESQEIEVERTLPVPVVRPSDSGAVATAAAAAVPAAASAAPPRIESTGVGTLERTGTDIFAPPAKSKTPLLVIGAIAAAILVAVIAFLFAGGGDEPEPPVVAATQPVAPPPPTGPSEEELQKQIEALIASRAGEMEDQIRQTYDEQLGDLRDQLDSARDANRRAREEAAERERQRLEAERRAAEEAAAPPPPPPPPPPVEVAEEKPEEAGEPAAETRVAEVTPPPPPRATPPPPPPPRAPQVRRGDLVTMGPGVKPPSNISFPPPRFPPMARRFNKNSASVKVRVLVDENGNVLESELAGEEAGYGFDAEALSAAKRATFEPPTKDGVPVKMWYTLSVVFRE